MEFSIDIPDDYYSDSDKICAYLNDRLQSIIEERHLDSEEDKIKVEREIHRKAIMCVSKKTELTGEDKSKLIQKILMFRWNQIHQLNNPVSPVEISKSYRDEENKILGCKHYIKKCYILAECCNKFYVCRLCHNENENHEIDRFQIKTCRCMECNTVQPISNECTKCHIQFANYYCNICHFFDGDITKQIFHCDKCGICRVGERSQFIHCDKCQGCFAAGHICLENKLKSNCPICFAYLFDTTESITVMKCGHVIHVDCLDEYIEAGNYTCPICHKSLASDMSSYYHRLDLHLAEETLPDEVKNLCNPIYCNDCDRKCYCKFHYLYNKCNYCGGYNTTVLGNPVDIKTLTDEEKPKVWTITETEE